MNARKDLDDHTPTLHVGSKIRLYGLLNQTLNGKKGSVTGPARNNRIGIQLQEEQRRVSVRISNIRYWDDPELSCQVLYERMVAKAHIEIATLRTEVKTQGENQGKKASTRHSHDTTSEAHYGSPSNPTKQLWQYRNLPSSSSS